MDCRMFRKKSRTDYSSTSFLAPIKSILPASGDVDKESVSLFCELYRRGVQVPPIDVDFSAEGSLKVVLGNARYHGFMMAMESGADIRNINCRIYREANLYGLCFLLRKLDNKPSHLLLKALAYGAISSAGFSDAKVRDICLVGNLDLKKWMIINSMPKDIKSALREGLISQNLLFLSANELGTEKSARAIMMAIQDLRERKRSSVSPAMLAEYCDF